MTFEKYQYDVNRDIDIISSYNAVISGVRKTFPHRTWHPENGGYDNLRRCMKYLILDKLRLSREEYITATSNATKFMKFHKLGTAFTELYHCNIYKLNQHTFPDWDIKPWENSHVTKGYWNTDTSIQAIKWLFEEKLRWDYEKIIQNIDFHTLKKYGFATMFEDIFKYSYYDLLNATYPDNNWDRVLLKQEVFKRKRANNPNAKLTESDVKNIRKLNLKGERKKVIADKYGLNITTVYNIVNEKIWKEDKPNE